MNIPIVPQEVDMGDDYENCVFCNINTIYWNTETNRPCCPVCSVNYTTEDISTAQFNY